jgi:hypothetical protein
MITGVFDLAQTSEKRPVTSEPRFYPFAALAALVFFRVEFFAAGTAFATTFDLFAVLLRLPSPMLFANSDLFAA